MACRESGGSSVSSSAEWGDDHRLQKAVVKTKQANVLKCRAYSRRSLSGSMQCGCQGHAAGGQPGCDKKCVRPDCRDTHRPPGRETDHSPGHLLGGQPEVGEECQGLPGGGSSGLAVRTHSRDRKGVEIQEPWSERKGTESNGDPQGVARGKASVPGVSRSHIFRNGSSTKPSGPPGKIPPPGPAWCLQVSAGHEAAWVSPPRYGVGAGAEAPQSPLPWFKLASQWPCPQEQRLEGGRAL